MVANWNLLGHEWAVRLLKGQVASGNFRHAYLFTGADGLGRRTLALRLAQALNCTNPPALGEFCGVCRACQGFARGKHADLLITGLQEGDREIKIDAVRELRRSLARTPLEAKVQMGLLLDFQLANDEANNALLKTLEEPNASVILCLTAPDADSLPETIVSRCEVLRLRPMAIDQLAASLAGQLSIKPEEAKLLASLSRGCPGQALQLGQDLALRKRREEWLKVGEEMLFSNRVQRFAFAAKISKDRQALLGLLLTWLSFWNDVVIKINHSSAPVSNADKEELLSTLSARLTPRVAQRTLQATARSLTQLTQTNVNARLAIEGLLLQIPTL